MTFSLQTKNRPSEYHPGSGYCLLIISGHTGTVPRPDQDAEGCGFGHLADKVFLVFRFERRLLEHKHIQEA